MQRNNLTLEELAYLITTDFIRELDSRKGFGHWWHNIDDDTQAELRETLEAGVLHNLKPFVTPKEDVQ